VSVCFWKKHVVRQKVQDHEFSAYESCKLKFKA
jgi:hypothetical protein